MVVTVDVIPTAPFPLSQDMLHATAYCPFSASLTAIGNCSLQVVQKVVQHPGVLVSAHER